MRQQKGNNYFFYAEFKHFFTKVYGGVAVYLHNILNLALDCDERSGLTAWFPGIESPLDRTGGLDDPRADLDAVE